MDLLLRRRAMFPSKKDYIEFADPEVLRVLLANGVGDGIGITYVDAAAVTSLNNMFQNNTTITTFNELKFFTGLAASRYPYGGQFSGCTNLTELWIAVIGSGNRIGSSNAFANLSALTTLNLEVPILIDGTGGFIGDTSLKRVNLSSLDVWYNSNFNRADMRPSYASGETHLYLIGSDEEITTIDYPSTRTSIPNGQFDKCIGLTSITIPSSVTSIGTSAFDGCSGLTGTLTIPSSVTSIGQFAFRECALNNIYNYSRSAYNANIYAYRAEILGAGGGTFYIAGSFNGGGYSGGYNWRFANIIVDGNWVASGNHQIVSLASGNGVKQIRIGGNVSDSGYSNDSIATGTGGTLEFLEVMGTKTGTGNAKFVTNDAGYYNGAIVHLGYNGIATTPAVCSASSSRIAHIYVGDGSSAAHDDAILAQYLADTDWAQYSAKLDTWYNYVQSGGEYATPPTIPTE